MSRGAARRLDDLRNRHSYGGQPAGRRRTPLALRRLLVRKVRAVEEITPRDGNVFEDIGFGFEEAVNLKIRSDAMTALVIWIEAKGYKQIEAATKLGVTRPEISNLQRGKIDQFSIDKLVNMLQRAGKSVRLEVTEVEPA